MKCMNCGTELNENSRFCSNCGIKIESSARCIHCGRTIIPQSAFCPFCGGRQSTQTIQNINYKTNQINNTKQLQQQSQQLMYDASNNQHQVYEWTKSGERKLVQCPRCKGTNCSYLGTDAYTIQEKKKTSYSVNLNPLKPFTVLNKKEKIKQPSQTIEIKNYYCYDCNKKFPSNYKSMLAIRIGVILVIILFIILLIEEYGI